MTILSMSDRDYQKLLRGIAAKVRELRLARGLTQEAMAELGFNYRFYQKVESGSYSPNLRTLHRLARALKVGVRDLMP